MSAMAGSEGQNRVVLKSGLAFDFNHGTPLDWLKLSNQHGRSLRLIEEFEARTEISDL